MVIQENFSEKIDRLYKTNTLTAFLITTGLNQLNDNVDKMTDEQLQEFFTGLFTPAVIRESLKEIYEVLNKN